MDLNFNSLVEEQKEACGVGFAADENNTEIIGRSEEARGHGRADGCLENNGTADKHSLEKLAELTAAINRFELEVVNTENPLRARSKSEPSNLDRSPKTVVVTPFDRVNENLARNPVRLRNGVATSAKPPKPAATSERKKRLELLPSLMTMDASKPSCDARYGLCRHIQEQWRETLTMDLNAANGEIPPGCVWNGEVPPRNYSNPTFSSKIFVGGVPWDITETALVDAFSPYGTCRVEWPSRETHSQGNIRNRGKMTGYVYMVFETERSVKSLLQDCSQEFGSAGEWYFKLKARRNQTTEIRQVQIIPWVVSDSSYLHDPTCRLDPTKTVFVGALHGMITAHVLYSIMNELYDDVVFTAIDTDKHKYPIGSGRVTFRSHSSYFRAIESGFLEIRTSKFCKKVQIDPFLEDAWCMVCFKAHGPYFCRDRSCFRYFCGPCWQARHSASGICANHRPLMRHSPRSTTLAMRNGDHENNVGTYNLPTPQRYLPVPGNVPVAPLGGVAAVAAIASGTVPRQQHHAYQYMQLAPAYPATAYTPTMPQHPVSTASPYVHQRLY
ncbi:hypothetical protein KIN20_024001 [Parelaphostrongylus tenuis]|uniref:RRM domain-containing protein n=1 Tax=Parelaphostrongylus tenuis TaxID=148309 RepID=A0AAD5NCK0_PARTN|nr:hypothetical protein KIN20_024001 [Parelaphostrongylus tenuis]